jgi:hypothetical protein
MEDPDPIAAYLLAVDPTSDAAVCSYISRRLRQLQQPFSYREAVRPPLDQLFKPNQLQTDRDETIRTAKIVHGYTFRQIAKAVNLHPSTVGKIFSRGRRGFCT